MQHFKINKVLGNFAEYKKPAFTPAFNFQSQAASLFRALKLNRARPAIRSARFYNTGKTRSIFDERFVNLHSHVPQGQRPERETRQESEVSRNKLTDNK